MFKCQLVPKLLPASPADVGVMGTGFQSNQSQSLGSNVKVKTGRRCCGSATHTHLPVTGQAAKTGTAEGTKGSGERGGPGESHLLGTTRETQEKGREVWCAHGKLHLRVKTLRCWARAGAEGISTPGQRKASTSGQGLHLEENLVVLRGG